MSLKEKEKKKHAWDKPTYPTGQDVRICPECNLPLCHHGRCINSHCPKFTHCTCLTTYQ